MNSIVVLKQVPDEEVKEEYQDIDKLNDSDQNVLKEALDLKDQYGGTVTVIGFGPSSAQDILKETLTYGIDEAILITDEKYKNLDIAQVAKIIASAIKKRGEYDLVFFGRQAIDGDSAHMAAMTAGALGIPLIPYSEHIEMKDHKLYAKCMGNQTNYKIETKIPAVALSIRERNKNRFPTVADIMKTYDGTYQIKILTNDDLNMSIDKRKVTQIRKYKETNQTIKKQVVLDGKNEEEKATKILNVLRQKNVI